jgi:hypothetical protein
MQLMAVPFRFARMDAIDDLAGAMAFDFRQVFPEEFTGLHIRRTYNRSRIYNEHGNSQTVKEFAQRLGSIRKELLRASKADPVRYGARHRLGIAITQYRIAPSTYAFHVNDFPLQRRSNGWNSPRENG